MVVKELEEKLSKFEDRYNPMNLYCRLREFGLKKNDCIATAKWYHTRFYHPIIETIKREMKGGSEENGG